MPAYNFVKKNEANIFWLILGKEETLQEVTQIFGNHKNINITALKLKYSIFNIL